MASVSNQVGPSGASSPRLIVLQVTDQDQNNTAYKDVRFLETRSKTELKAQLRGDWVRSNIQPSHVARIILISKDGEYIRWKSSNFTQHDSTITIDNRNNLLILHPDTLVSGTTVADSFRCLRKSILTARTPPSFAGEAALFGSMIHDLFQNVLVLDSNIRDYSTTEELTQTGGVDLMSFFEIVEDILFKHSHSLFAIKISLAHARKVLHKIVPQLMEWYQSFMGSGNYHNTQGVLVPFGGKALSNVTVTKVHDIEELVWSPVLGLKGKIDASVHLRVDGEDKGVAVLELKTGKSLGFSSVSHSAQVSLYQLLLSDRKGSPVTHGLLTYIRYQKALQSVKEDDAKQIFDQQLSNGGHNEEVEGHVKLKDSLGKIQDDMSHRLVATAHSELVALIMQRNEVAAHLRTDIEIEDLPPVLVNQKETCERCFATDSCMIQHKLLEKGSEETVKNGPGLDLFWEKAGHLTPAHAEYYSFWRTVLADEEEHASRDLHLMWTMPAKKREVVGKCASNLVLFIPVLEQTEDDVIGMGSQFSTDNGTNVSPHQLLGPGSRTIAIFKRSSGNEYYSVVRGAAKPIHKSISDCGFSVGDYVLVSAERCKKHHSTNSEKETANGNDEEYESCETWQNALTNGFVHEITSDSIHVSVDRSLAAWCIHQGVSVGDVLWRIDGEETAISHNIAKRTLLSLFSCEASEEGVTRRRQLIVDGVTPVFASPSNKPGPQPKTFWNGSSVAQLHLNDEQRRAVDLSFQARDYLLILGMPGTGKTATLASIVVAHAKMGKSILLCSHTNTAVDNLLRRLLSLGFDDFIRLGRNKNVVDEHIHKYHISAIIDDDHGGISSASNWTTIEKHISERRVVATTCLGIGHWVLEGRNKFDLVVIDEASQMMQPICLGPLLFLHDGGVFILVGDHYQLPPLQRATVGTGRRLTNMEREREQQNSIMNCETEESGQMETDLSKMHSVKHQCEESLFRRLCEKHPEAMVLLSKQYRMAGDIMDLCNKAVYGGSLKCGSDSVRNQKLETLSQKVGSNIQVSNWLEHVRDPNRRVIFIDTQQQQQQALRHDDASTRGDGELENQLEANIIKQATEKLIRDGIKAKSLTVLTPYRAQVNLLKSVLEKGCEVSTVDQYQGKDNDCVIISFVRSSGEKEKISIGQLLKDWRRVNVAITRAKCKLILVGCAQTLTHGTQFLGHIVQYLSEIGALVRYSKDSKEGRLVIKK